MSDINNPGGNEVPENQPPAAPPPPPAGSAGDTPPPPPAPEYHGGVNPADGEYSVGKAFTWGWNKYRDNFGPIILAIILYAIIGFVIALIFGLLAGATGGATTEIKFNPDTGQVEAVEAARSTASLIFSILGNVILAIYGWFVAAGIVRGVLKVARGEKLELSDLLPTDKTGPVIIGSIIVGLVAGILGALGFVIFPILALIWVFFSAFWLYYLYDKDQPVVDAIKSSWSFVLANLVQVIIFVIVAVIANIIGAVLCLVGLLVTIPVTYLAQGYLFRRLNDEEVSA